MEEKEVLTIAEIYGYVRVSTKDQNADRQMIALRELAVPETPLSLSTSCGVLFSPYAFLAGADHGRYEKEKWTRRQSPYVPPWSYTVSGLRWFRIDEKKRRL
ncbi:hypothetical protein AAAV51_09570 [Agathobaculum butyriciproducens]|uniref:Resolvase/invertase-type recombinase catalytic domain-containing protein n=1 Tax=Agathobaculum butyriciproducens TaxID=1628085 RepID=A0AAW4VWS0_9FIRM|nr:hypothetical protein [Agathobaculum butyriciproducens]